MNYFKNDFPFTIDPLQSVYNHCTYHDPIESWLEYLFHTRFPVNNNFLILSLLEIILDSFDFDFCILLFSFLLSMYICLLV